jgi:hypothetical protein
MNHECFCRLSLVAKAVPLPLPTFCYDKRQTCACGSALDWTWACRSKARYVLCSLTGSIRLGEVPECSWGLLNLLCRLWQGMCVSSKCCSTMPGSQPR